jgi:general stress protein 26
MKYQLQQKIQDILDRCIDMTIATVRPDGAPQATVVSFVHDGLTIYFVCGASSQKVANIAIDPRVAVTVTPPYNGWDEIEGLSIAAIADVITDAKEMSEIGGFVQQRFPQINQMQPVAADEIKFVRLRPLHVSVLDYSKGFGHADLVAIGANDIAVSSQSTRHRWLTPTAMPRQSNR